MNLHLTPTHRNAPAKKVPQPTDIAVGARVRRLRQARGMSQEKLGEHLGITFQQIQKYEKGTNRIGAGRLSQIARVLDVEVAKLFDGIEQGSGEMPAQFSAAEIRMIEAIRRLPSGAASAVVNMIETFQSFQNESK